MFELLRIVKLFGAQNRSESFLLIFDYPESGFTTRGNAVHFSGAIFGSNLLLKFKGQMLPIVTNRFLNSVDSACCGFNLGRGV